MMDGLSHCVYGSNVHTMYDSVLAHFTWCALQSVPHSINAMRYSIALCVRPISHPVTIYNSSWCLF